MQSQTQSTLAGSSTMEWKRRPVSSVREYIQALVVIGAVTLVGWYISPIIGHLAFGLVYLLAVIILSLHLGRWPVFVAGVLSATLWDYIIIPPHYSFAVTNFQDGMMLATYCIVTLVAGHLTGQIKEQEQAERFREQRAVTLYNLSRALTDSHSLDEAVTTAIGQAASVFGTPLALLLPTFEGKLKPHPANTYKLSEPEQTVSEWVLYNRQAAGRFSSQFSTTATMHLPLIQGGVMLGVFVIKPPEVASLPPFQRDMIESFAGQLAQQIEREQIRTANERGEVLAASEKLQRILFDCVSHELKTPLAVITTVVAKLKTADASRRDNLLDELNTALKRLNRLVTNLLSQSRLESGVLSLRIDWCNVRDVIHAALREANDVLAGHPVKTQIAPDLLLLKADAPLLEQAVFNLLHNAARHTPPATAIDVSAGLVPEKKRAYIAVADHGTGLAPEVRTNPFRHNYSSGSNRTGGLGLGLSIVHGFIVAHGGEVTASDREGGGTVFTIYLPYAPHGNVPDE